MVKYVDISCALKLSLCCRVFMQWTDNYQPL